MSPTNILIMVHGMTPDVDPVSPYPQYQAFWRRLLMQRPQLGDLIGRRIGVQWGHAMPNLHGDAQLAERVIAREWGYELPDAPAQLRPDQQLTAIQRRIGELVNYSQVRREPGANDRLIADLGVPGLRQLSIALREAIVLRGLGDVVYYLSATGERASRRTVYAQILRGLDDVAAADELRLHIVAHSLGVTIAHDFLFGLFAKDHSPDYIDDVQGSAHDLARYEYWRERAQATTLQVGSFVSMASQLPLFMLRNATLTGILHNGGLLDPGVIGIAPDDPQRRWVNFYDVDDILGFPTRRLYQLCPALAEIQVDSGDLPDRAHTGYWDNPTVIAEAAELLATNCR